MGVVGPVGFHYSAAMTSSSSSARAGALAAFGAFLCWGLFGLYFKALGDVPAAEVLAHRVLGGALFALLLMAVLGGLRDLKPLGADRSAVLRLGASALAIAVNWGLFVWSVAHGRALEASLGYYIYPLVSVLLGRVLLGEAMTRRQAGAVALVAVGVGWQISHGSGVPWVALGLGVSFAAYGLLRKTIAVPALAGLVVETVWLAPLAVLYLAVQGGGVVPDMGGTTLALLALAGPVTAVPLALFAYGARRLKLSTIGLMMYMNPTVQMLVAVFALGEVFTPAHAVTFAAIWGGVALYAWPRRA